MSTKDLRMHYVKSESVASLEAIWDASHGSEEGHKSTLGYLILVFGNLIHFKSKKQNSRLEQNRVGIDCYVRMYMWNVVRS